MRTLRAIGADLLTTDWNMIEELKWIYLLNECQAARQQTTPSENREPNRVGSGSPGIGLTTQHCQSGNIMMLAFTLLLYAMAIFKSRLLPLQPCWASSIEPSSLEGQTSSENATQDEIPLLPPVSDNSEGYRKLSLGDTLKLDDLGPIIINPDGTTRRIANWANLTKFEQDNTWRLISARNKRRIAALQAKKEDEGDVLVDQEDKSDT
eukprot:scaffold2135_cov154-Ochromonas_danica.AAC.2